MAYFKIKQEKQFFPSLYRYTKCNLDHVLMIALILLSIALFIAESRSNKYTLATRNNIQYYISNFVYYLEKPIIVINRFITKFNNYYTDTEYKNFLKNNTIETALFQKIVNENNRLKTMLKYVETINIKERQYVTTKIITKIEGLYSHYAFIKLGYKNGIKKNQAVINEQGLVGKISEVSENSAKILFITDIQCRISAIGSKSNYRIIISGNNDNYLNALYSSDWSQLEKGELFVTAGDFNFPSDISIGIINNNMMLEPVVNFNKLNFVSVILDSN